MRETSIDQAQAVLADGSLLTPQAIARASRKRPATTVAGRMVLAQRKQETGKREG